MKRFKAFLMSLVLVTCMLGTSGSVNAASYSTGKAVIPSYTTNSNSCCYCFVSNITDNPINVTVTLYDMDGSIVIDDNDASAGRITNVSGLLNYCDENSNSSLTFTLNAHSTGVFSLPFTTSLHIGYGVINWFQDSNALQGLVAWGAECYTEASGDADRASFEINSGLPF